MLEISVVLLYAGSPAAVFSVAHVLVKHFTPLSFGLHALGGICYTVICHRVLAVLVTPLPHFGRLILGPVRSDTT